MNVSFLSGCLWGGFNNVVYFFIFPLGLAHFNITCTTITTNNNNTNNINVLYTPLNKLLTYLVNILRINCYFKPEVMQQLTSLLNWNSMYF